MISLTANDAAFCYYYFYLQPVKRASILHGFLPLNCHKTTGLSGWISARLRRNLRLCREVLRRQEKGHGQD